MAKVVPEFNSSGGPRAGQKRTPASRARFVGRPACPFALCQTERHGLESSPGEAAQWLAKRGSPRLHCLGRRLRGARLEGLL